MNEPDKKATWLQNLETATPDFNLRGERWLVYCLLPLSFLYKILDSLYGKNTIDNQPWPYILLLAAFTAVAFCSLFALATAPGERWVQKKITAGKAHHIALIPPVYFFSYVLLLWLGDFSQLPTHALAKIPAGLSGIPWPVVVLLSGLLMYAGLAAGIWLAMRTRSSVFAPRHLAGVLAASLPFLVLQEFLPLVWCFTTPAAAVVMVFATGLGRRHFCFSFVPRSGREALQVCTLLACGIALFLSSTLGMGTVSYTGGLWRSSWYVVADSAFVWIFIVGVSEEIIFRCGLLTLVSDWFSGLTARTWLSRRPRLAAVLVISLVFGLAHVSRGATMFFLSILASLLYGLAFVAGKTLFGPVMLHGMLNILVLMNFHLTDFQ